MSSILTRPTPCRTGNEQLTTDNLKYKRGMKKAFFLAVPLVAVTLLLSGCSFPGTLSSKGGAAVLKSTDGGKTYLPTVTIDAKTTFAPADIVSFVFESGNSKRILVGTRENGIFTTENGGEVWKKMNFPPTKTYGLVSDWNRPERLYASGEWQGRGKIYKSDNRGEKWDEIYSEPNTGTVITALMQSPRNASTIFVGTSAGVMIRTTDGGLTWGNLESVEAPVLSFAFDASGDVLYALLSGKGIVRSRDGGATFEEIPGKSERSVTKSLPTATALAPDPSRSGMLFVGTKEGLFRSSDFGDSWEEVSILESSKKFSIRAIAINPKNSNELLYSAALALYKSIDGGKTWSVTQLDGSRAAGFLRYDPSDSNTIYAAFRIFN